LTRAFPALTRTFPALTRTFPALTRALPVIERTSVIELVEIQGVRQAPPPKPRISTRLS
jgi:hypothetical protein